MERIFMVGLVFALLACGGSPTSPTPIADLTGSWDWQGKYAQPGGGFLERPTGWKVVIQQTGGSFTATSSPLASSQPDPGVSATGTVTAERSFSMQLRDELSRNTCSFTGVVDPSATRIDGTQSCCQNGFCNPVAFTFRRL